VHLLRIIVSLGETTTMRLRATIFSLALLLALGAACNKPSTPAADNSAQGSDASGSANAGSNSSGSANSQDMARSEQPRAPEAVTVPSGKVLTVRLSDAVGSKISQPGQSFGGTLARAVEVNGETVIPAGARVSGEVVDAKPLGRFAGGALLQLRLNSVSVNGEQMPVQTATFTQTLKGKGKRTGVLAGGGAGLGALIGGLTRGGKGAAIGAAAGAGAGGAGAAFTGNKEIELPAESAVPFTLKASLKIRR
jgi:hypothetical protein